MAEQEVEHEAPRIGLAAAKALFDTGQGLFVDVRSHQAYEQSHVPGAVSMPLRELPRRYLELPRDQRLVFY